MTNCVNVKLFCCLLWLIAACPCSADVTGTYAMSGPAQIGCLQLDQNGNVLNGSLQLITASTNSPGYTISNSNLSGTIHGSKIIIRYIDFLSSSQLFTGEKHSSLLVIDFPKPDGHLLSAQFKPTSTFAWNSLVTTFETRMGRSYDLRILYADYQSTRTSYDRYVNNLPSDVAKIQDLVKKYNTDHANEAKAEVTVDQTNAIHDQVKSNYDKLDSSSSTDEQQLAARAVDSAANNLYSAESALWDATDNIWRDLSGILQLRNSIASDEDNLSSLFTRAQNDLQNIRLIEALLKRVPSINNRKYPINTKLELKRALDQINSQVNALLPQPQPPITGQGVVIVDSAAVRNYQVDDGSLHSNVTVILTVLKGQYIHHIQGQTFNDYIIMLSSGTLGLIAKSDVHVLENAKD